MPEISQKTVFVVKKEDREYSFICNPNASLGEAYDSLQVISRWIIAKIQENQDNAEMKEETPKEEAYAPV